VSSSEHRPNNRRAVITGFGPVTPIGIGKDAFWAGLLSERSAISKVTRFDTSANKAKHAAEIGDLDILQWFPSHQAKRWDRYTQMAMIGAKLALQDSGLELKEGQLYPRYGISFGTALGGIANAEEEHANFLTQGPKAVSRALALQIFGGSAHGNMSIAFGLQGPANTNSNSCASGNVALGEGLRWIREGLADVVLAGASEAPLSPLTFTAFDLIHTMSREGNCRPFDQARDGFVMGEGAACFILESYEHAMKRGARIYAELVGYSLVSEAHHMTIPRPDGEPLRRVMRMALNDAQLNTSNVSYISTHGSSTPQNDSNEAAQISAVFGSDAPPVSGTKAYVGHALGAAGAIECAISLLALENQWLPPTLHFEKADEGVTLDLIPNHGRSAKVSTVMSNAFGFGGVDSCLILQKMSS